MTNERLYREALELMLRIFRERNDDDPLAQVIEVTFARATAELASSESEKIAEDVRTYGAGLALHLPNGVVKRLSPNEVGVQAVPAQKPND